MNRDTFYNTQVQEEAPQLVPTTMQHKEWKGFSISVVIIAEPVLTNIYITQTIAHLNQIISIIVQMHNQDEYARTF